MPVLFAETQNRDLDQRILKNPEVYQTNPKPESSGD
jgi:hypothetical protein